MERDVPLIPTIALTATIVRHAFHLGETVDTVRVVTAGYVWVVTCTCMPMQQKKKRKSISCPEIPPQKQVSTLIVKTKGM